VGADGGASEAGDGDTIAELPEVVLGRARFTVAYHGARFRGFAPNHGVRTVMGDLTAAMAKVVRRPVELTGAGRTDAGVHAWGQVVSGDLPSDTDLHKFARRINKLCAPDVSLRDGQWVDHDFDARFSATWRRYRYHVWSAPAPNPLLADISWHVGRSLDLDAMQAAARGLLGEHDFTSFCRKPKVDADHSLPSMVRIMHDVSWTRVDESPMLRFEITGSAFCHQQVRSTVGTLVDIGLGRLPADSIPGILEARDRAAAGSVAPPHGLVLWAVGYDGRRWDAEP
jgi:tRNA pseudouridine38-40 synthase